MKTIPLTQGKVALVDDEDWEFLRLTRWCAHRKPRTTYAVRTRCYAGGGRVFEQMHRLVLERALGRPIYPGMECDHEDGNGLNNQRSNLREVTKRGNCENKHVVKTSRYLGVSRYRSSGKWMAQIGITGKVLNLGYYATELEAAMEREVFIKAHPELMAKSNF